MALEEEQGRSDARAVMHPARPRPGKHWPLSQLAIWMLRPVRVLSGLFQSMP